MGDISTVGGIVSDVIVGGVVVVVIVLCVHVGVLLHVKVQINM